MENNSERMRDKQLAMYLHDGPVQILYSIQLKINRLRKMASLSAVKKEFDWLEKMTELSISQTKKVILQLAPPKVVGSKFVDGMKYYLEKLKEVNNITCEFKVKMPGYVTFDFGNEIMRVFLEAINNVQKHSRANKVKVCLSASGKKIELTVEDNGVGFAPSKDNYRYGIKSMFSYAEGVNGHVSIKSAPDKGTTVKFTVPCSIT